MPDLWPLLGFFAFAYGAASSGLLAALAARLWTTRAGRVPTASEATWCAFLPVLAVLATPVFALVEPSATGPLGAWHETWHLWERTIHATPFLHGSLHFGNALLLGLTALAVGRTVYQASRICSYEAALRRMALQHGTTPALGDYHRLPSARPFCFTLGIICPAIYVTEGLLAELTPSEQAAMVAHERAHLRRRDPLVRPLLTLCYGLLLLPGGFLLLRDWSRAAERDCDAEAGYKVGSRADVAAALVHVARLMCGQPVREAALSAFAGHSDDIEGRVKALLAPVSTSTTWGTWLLPAMSVSALLPLAFWLRHAVEFFVHH